ncbi:MAG: hypothetical protein ABIA04_09095 [Pseudomonadota bacterium]
MKINLADIKKTLQTKLYQRKNKFGNNYFLINTACCYETGDDSSLSSLNRVFKPDEASILIITGPINKKMQAMVIKAYENLQKPKLVFALGNCTDDCRILKHDSENLATLHKILNIDYFIPGCPAYLSQLDNFIKDLAT